MTTLKNRQTISLLSLVIITSLFANTPLLAADLNDDSSGHAVSNDNNGDGSDWGDDGDAEWGSDDWGDEEEEESPIEISHTIWGGSGWFINDNDLIDNNNTLLEARYRLDVSGYYKSIYGVLKLEAIADDVADETTIESREAYILFSPVSNIDIKAGRQILTWGTGDLFFLNDMFPKDWQSFFSGREMEYLKAPSDALKFSTFNSWVNFDIVWTPEFDPDVYLTGERFSFFNPMTGQQFAAPPKLNPDEPTDDEIAVRLFRNLGSSELALYGYKGFNKQPLAFAPTIGQIYFPEWQVYGASARNPLAGGIGNIEIAWHRSMEDKDGQNPFIPNSEVRFLLGFEKEIIRKLNLGLQYYLEHKQDYDNLISNSYTPNFEPEENRHVVSARLNYRTLQDKLTWSFFGFYSPTDDDYYVIPSISYRANDLLTLDAGANIFQGKENYTFFGQLEDNSNIYTRIKLSF